MGRLSSIALMLIGLGAVVVGIAGGVAALAELYQGALDAPLEMGADAEDETSRNMLLFVVIGLGGFVPLLLGAYFWRVDRVRAKARARG